MDSKTTELLEKDKVDRSENDTLAGLSEDGPIKYLSMDADKFNLMTVDELLSAAAALNALAFQVQRFQSDNESSANRVERYLNSKINLAAHEYIGYWEERKSKALNESAHLMSVYGELSKVKQRAEQHKFLAKSINDLASTLIKKADLKSRRWKD